MLRLPSDHDSPFDLFIEQIADRYGRLPSERIGYPEAEAAELLGIGKHVLRDARLRGEIHATKIGKRIVYSRNELMRWLGD